MSKKQNRAPNPPWPEKLKVWVRSGGRCAFCNAYLLESDLTLRPIFLGEIAHNRASSDRGPRSDPNTSDEERNKAENLLLVCGAHHPDMDKADQLDLLTIDQIRQLKQTHETKIRLATERVGGQRTAILRVQGNVKGAAVDISSRDAAEAVIRSSNRFPDLQFSYDRQGVEIDLRHLPGEVTGTPEYYRAACERIDEVMSGRFKPAVEKGEVEHVSVLAIARLPVLVYFGSRLDDTIPTDIFQRHRSSESWVWGPDAEDDPEFLYRTERLSNVSSTQEASLIVNASGTIHPNELPDELGGKPLYVIELSSGTPHTDTVSSRKVRDSFERAIRGLLAHIESENKSVERLHVFAAAPVSIAITLGRAVGWKIHPNLLIYDRESDGTYQSKLEVNPP